MVNIVPLAFIIGFGMGLEKRTIPIGIIIILIYLGFYTRAELSSYNYYARSISENLYSGALLFILGYVIGYIIRTHWRKGFSLVGKTVGRGLYKASSLIKQEAKLDKSLKKDIKTELKEVKKESKIVKSIKSEIDKAISYINKGDFSKFRKHIRKAYRKVSDAIGIVNDLLNIELKEIKEISKKEIEEKQEEQIWDNAGKFFRNIAKNEKKIDKEEIELEEKEKKIDEMEINNLKRIKKYLEALESYIGRFYYSVAQGDYNLASEYLRNIRTLLKYLSMEDENLLKLLSKEKRLEKSIEKLDKIKRRLLKSIKNRKIRKIK